MSCGNTDMVILGGRVGVGLGIVADDLGAARAVCIVLQASHDSYLRAFWYVCDIIFHKCTQDCMCAVSMLCVR